MTQTASIQRWISWKILNPAAKTINNFAMEILVGLNDFEDFRGRQKQKVSTINESIIGNGM